jgi:hypothetical protein
MRLSIACPAPPVKLLEFALKSLRNHVGRLWHRVAHQCQAHSFGLANAQEGHAPSRDGAAVTMGSAFSTAVAIVKTFLEIATLYSRTLSRFNLSPGVPCPYPTRSFWISDDDDKDKSLLSGETPPEYADVVIIGSGITGASIAHTLLTRLSESQSTIKKIVMVDARGICSGATGRNGGHIKTDNYGSYGSFKKSFGKETALNLDKFRNRALQELKAIDKECCGGKGQVRDVEALDCFFADDTFQKAKAKLQVWRDDAGETEGHYTHEIYEGAEARRVRLVFPFPSSH